MVKKKIRGTVRQNPQVLDNCCMFTVRQGDDMYLVISTERQAAKDHIFVKQGEEICIEGNCIADMDIKGIILTERAEIKLSRPV